MKRNMIMTIILNGNHLKFSAFLQLKAIPIPNNLIFTHRINDYNARYLTQPKQNRSTTLKLANIQCKKNKTSTKALLLQLKGLTILWKETSRLSSGSNEPSKASETPPLFTFPFTFTTSWTDTSPLFGSGRPGFRVSIVKSALPDINPLKGFLAGTKSIFLSKYLTEDPYWNEDLRSGFKSGPVTASSVFSAIWDAISSWASLKIYVGS